MAIEPMTLFAVGGALWKLFFDPTRQRRAGVSEPVYISAVDVETFTGVEVTNAPGALNPTRTRRFDHDITANMMRVLRARSAKQVAFPELDRALNGVAITVYQIVPPELGAPPAADVIDHAARHGLVALGSLSCCFLLTGSTWPMILVVGPPGTEQLAIAGVGPDGGPAAQFARIHPPSASTVVETTADPVADTAPAPSPFPPPPEVVATIEPAKANGIHAPAKAAEVVTVPAEAEEG